MVTERERVGERERKIQAQTGVGERKKDRSTDRSGRERGREGDRVGERER